MKDRYLSDIIKIKSRYTRSINLERDLEASDKISTYIITAKAEEFLRRFFQSYESPNSVRAWTITGTYGSGKSSLALFLLALAHPNNSELRKIADKILEYHTGIVNPIENKGMLLAYVTAFREPINNTIFRALKNGIKKLQLNEFDREIETFEKLIENNKLEDSILIEFIKSLAFKFPILILIDELGKNFEYSASYGQDLYILQQIAEMANTTEFKLFFIGLLHQSINDYAYSLTLSQRKEWEKIQGRFEHFVFYDSIDSYFHLISNAIEQSEINQDYNQIAERWHETIKSLTNLRHIEIEDIKRTYPLHPFSVIALPIIFNKYAQSDRTLFNFLSSFEPYSFRSFINETKINGYELFKIYRVYDYFIENLFMNSSILNINRQKIIEIHNRILDARGLSDDQINLLKTIGVLNILFTTGLLKASKNNILLSMCNDPNDIETKKYLEGLLDRLVEKGFIIYRQKIDEYRIWEGSDFDLDNALTQELQRTNLSIAKLLNQHYQLKPIIANKYSYETGTLRLFERIFVDKENSEELFKVSKNFDGRICYLIDNFNITIREKSDHEKPIVYILGKQTEKLIELIKELSALNTIITNYPQLQRDAVARKEVLHRIFITKKLISNQINISFSQNVDCFYNRTNYTLSSDKQLDDILSSACEQCYLKGIKLNNELINRNYITSQISKARNLLISAMINNSDAEQLGLVGYGPEVTIYKSLLLATGIHKKDGDKWIFSEPKIESGVYEVWKKIEDYCLSATDRKKTFDILYEELQNPPFGVRKGILPILLTSVLIYHSDSLCLYYDDTYMPILDSNYLQLLPIQPEKFAVKCLREIHKNSLILNQMQREFSKSLDSRIKNLRNSSILTIVNFFISFINSLPKCTLNSKKLSPKSQLLITSIKNAKDPENLLFENIPKILDTYPLNYDNLNEFIIKLKSLLKELEEHYFKLKEHCIELICKSFNIQGSLKEIRKALSSRAYLIKNTVVEDKLREFVHSICDDSVDDERWFSSLVTSVVDRPIEIWYDDETINKFEASISILSKRFKYFEALMGNGVNLRNNQLKFNDSIGLIVNITNSEGKEIYDTIFLDKKKIEEIQTKLQQILNNSIIAEFSEEEKKFAALYLFELADKNLK